MSIPKSTSKRVKDAKKAPQSSRTSKPRLDVSFKSSEFVGDSNGEEDEDGAGQVGAGLNEKAVGGTSGRKLSKPEKVVNEGPAQARKIVNAALQAAKTNGISRIGGGHEETSDSDGTEDEDEEGSKVDATRKSDVGQKSEDAASSSEDETEEEEGDIPQVNGSKSTTSLAHGLLANGQQSSEGESDSDSEEEDEKPLAAAAAATNGPTDSLQANEDIEPQTSSGEESESLEKDAKAQRLQNGATEDSGSESEESESEAEAVSQKPPNTTSNPQSQRPLEASSNQKAQSKAEDESDSGDSSGSDDEIEDQSHKPAEQHSGEATSPKIIPFQPPHGFSLADISAVPPSRLAELSNSGDLDGREIFHISAPKVVPISTIKSFAYQSLSDGSAVVSHGGSDYGFAPSGAKGSSNSALLVPSPDDNAYNPIKISIARSFQLRQLIKLPDLSTLNSPPSRSAQHPNSEPTQTKKAQPPGLKMRSHAFGLPGAAFEEFTSDDEMEDAPPPPPKPQFVRPEFPRPSSPSKKRKHAEVESAAQPSSQAKKSKKSEKRRDSNVTSKSLSPPLPAQTPSIVPVPSNKSGHLQLATPSTSRDSPVSRKDESKEDKLKRKEERQRRKLSERFQVPSRRDSSDQVSHSSKGAEEVPTSKAAVPTPKPSQTTAVIQATPTPKPTGFVKASTLPIPTPSQTAEPIAHALQDEAADQQSFLPSNDRQAQKAMKKAKKEEKKRLKEAAKATVAGAGRPAASSHEKQPSPQQPNTEFNFDVAQKAKVADQAVQGSDSADTKPARKEKKERQLAVAGAASEKSLFTPSATSEDVSANAGDSATTKQQRKSEKEKQKAVSTATAASTSTPNPRPSVPTASATSSALPTTNHKIPHLKSDASKIATASDDAAALTKQQRKEAKKKQKEAAAAPTIASATSISNNVSAHPPSVNAALTASIPATTLQSNGGQINPKATDEATTKAKRKEEKRKQKAVASSGPPVNASATPANKAPKTPASLTSTPALKATQDLFSDPTNTSITSPKRQRKRDRKRELEATTPAPTLSNIATPKPPVTSISHESSNNENGGGDADVDVDTEMPDTGAITPISTSKIDPLLMGLNITPFPTKGGRDGETKEEKARRRAEKRAKKEERRRKAGEEVSS